MTTAKRPQIGSEHNARPVISLSDASDAQAEFCPPRGSKQQCRGENTEARIRMPKHVKLRTPTDRDLRENPMIGGSKGVVLAGATPDDLEEAQGVNTIEGDLENDTNAAGGLDKSVNRSSRSRRPG